MTSSLAVMTDPPFSAHEAGLRGSRSAPKSAPDRDGAHGAALTGMVRNFAQNSELYADGDEVRFFYKVVSGVVRTCKFLSDGRRQIDGFHAAGEIFGLEMSAEHTLSAEAVTDCSVIAYRWRGLQAMDSQAEPTAPQVFSYAMRCLERAQHHSLLFGRRSAAQRLAAFLLEMARAETDVSAVDLAMTRQDIADYLGLTIETVSRTLSQFERDRLIALPSARHVVLRNRTILAYLSE
jgi:CRP/FNR family nitrogen fixation transcriptional regulator